MNDSVSIMSGKPDPEVIARTPQCVRWDPLTLLPALALVTRRIGLIATANTTYNDPYTLARRLSSLDWLSGGRSGWNLVTSLSGGGNFSQGEHVLHSNRYDRAEEFVDVIRGLWDSWDDDAFVQDKASGIWCDPSRMNTLDYQGQHFSVKGPLNAHRPLQGYPVMVQAGSSGPGRDLGARTAELIFTAASHLEEAIAFNRDMTSRLDAFGRSREEIKILPGVLVFVGRTEEQAIAKCDDLLALSDTNSRLKALSQYIGIGVDLSQFPIDGPVPIPAVLPDTNIHKSRQQLVMELIRRELPTIRQLLRSLVADGHLVVIGTPSKVADVFQTWLNEGAADGFNVMFDDMSSSIDDFVDLVVPELQRRGLFRADYTGTTLREHLGFQRPLNSFSARKGAPLLRARD